MPHAARASGFRLSTGTCLAGYFLTPTAELPNVERGSVSTSDPSILGMSQNQAIRTEKIIRFSPLAAARPLNILSRPESQTSVAPGAPAGWPSAAVPALSMICPSSPKQLAMVSPELQITRLSRSSKRRDARRSMPTSRTKSMPVPSCPLSSVSRLLRFLDCIQAQCSLETRSAFCTGTAAIRAQKDHS